MSSSSVALAGLTAEEQITDAAMDKQIRRFGHMFGEVHKRIAQLEPACAKAETGATADAAAAAILQSSYLHLLELKSLSRSLTNLSESTKSHLQCRKKRLDAVNLQLESTLYEHTHLQKEIAIARDFRSKFPTVELVSQEEFKRSTGLGGAAATATADAAGEDAAMDGAADPASLTPHALHLARLRDEVARRTRLLSVQRAAESQSASLQAEVNALKARDVLFTTRVQEMESANRALMREFWPDHPVALLASAETDKQVHALPPPLYSLYFMADSFVKVSSAPVAGGVAEADAARMHIEIRGSVAESQRLRDSDTRAAAGIVAAAPSSSSAASTPAEQMSQFVQRHPMTLQLHLRLAAPASSVTLSFAYHPQLQLVSADAEGARLEVLFAGDSGAALPFDAAAYPAKLGDTLQAALRSPQAATASPLGGTARPYRWAQQLAGIALPVATTDEPVVTFRMLVDRIAQRAAAAGAV